MTANPPVRADSFFKPQPNRAGGDQVSIAVTIRSYGLQWNKVRDYLMQTVNVDKLHKTQVLEDTFIFYLPRDLNQSEIDEINKMRVVAPPQKQRLEERPDHRQVRPLGEFD